MSAPAGEVRDLLDLLEDTLVGEARRDVVGRALVDDPRRSLRRLRSQLTAGVLSAGPRTISLGPLVTALDERTSADGFRVLHSWNHTTHTFTEDVTPVLMLDHFEAEVVVEAGAEAEIERGPGGVGSALAILLDYYLLHLLALCAMRAWDDPEPDAVLDRVTSLLDALQGPDGSRHRFVGDAEAVIVYALSQFHPEEHAYDRFVDRAEVLRPARRVRLAAVSAGVLSAHLRWGFWLMYDRDVLRMRDDNVGDYPWLLDSVLTLARAYAASVDAGEPPSGRAEVVEALVRGLAADPWALTGSPPPALRPFRDRHEDLVAILRSHGGPLLAEMEEHRPTKDGYAPLALHFNFPHNALVALVAISLETGAPRGLPLDALLSRSTASGPDAERAMEAARDLTRYSGASPDRLGTRGAMLVAYDPLTALRSFTMTRDAVRELVGG